MTKLKNTEITNWFFTIISQYKKPITLILLGLFSIIILMIAFNSYSKDYVNNIISSLINNQIKAIDKNFEKELKTRDNVIQDLQKRLSTSEKTYTNLKKRIGNVEIKIVERKPPETSAELRTRFSQLGYKSVN